MSLFDDLLGSVTAPPRGRNRRISSNEQPNWNDGNFDMTRLAPGEVFEFPVLDGPGVINHIWFTSHAGGVNELNAISLRIYWDGREEPGVEVPLGEFFAVGQGSPAVVESVPVQLGIRDNASEQVELRAGVSVGDTLLTNAAQGLAPGTKVRITVAGDRPTGTR